MEQQTSLRISDDLLAKLDAWRAEQPLKPSRAQAIRMFIEMALTPASSVVVSVKKTG